jgi:site-specific DNA recombinase
MAKTKMPATKRYRVGGYARLSVDDDNAGTSGSVLNQLALIRDFVESKEDLSISAEYTDDGYSGSTFENRPGWGRLLSDIQERKVDCIVVKDLSRLGRNYLDVSRYLDQIFPAIGVRVIAITDGYDSKSRRSSADSIMLPIKNLFNDMYCRDASAKTRASLSAKRKRGEFVGSFAPYGYKRGSGENRGQLIVDPEPAGIVRTVFDARIGGMSPGAIAEMLNEGFVPTPYEYFKSQGHPRSSNFCKSNRTSWSPRTIIRMLSNEVYAGTLVQGKTRKPDFRRKEVMAVDESEWERKPGAHEAIVDRTTFDLAQKLAERDMRLAPGARTSLPLSGFLFCGDCGATMARHASRCARGKGGKHYYYSCESHRKDKGVCSMHKIWEDDLKAAILSAVRQCALSAVVPEDALADAERYRHDRRGNLTTRLNSVGQRIEHNRELRLHMYSDYVEGIINKNQYAELAKAVDDRLHALNGEKKQVEKELAQIEDGRAETWEQALAHYADATELERVMVVELIDRVLVHGDGSIEVVFRFGDPLEVDSKEEVA